MPAICQIIHAINFDFCNYMCQVLWLLEIPKIANAESLSWRKPQPNIGGEEGNIIKVSNHKFNNRRRG